MVSKRTMIARNGAGRLALVLFLLIGSVAQGSEPDAAPTGPSLANDPVLSDFVRDALATRPEMARAQAEVDAERERVPQARALPDPMLSFGIQNDGFRGIQIGKMEGSFVSIMASQTFPWHGKRGLRGDVTALGARQAEADADRARLTVQAEVARAYLDLLLARDQLALLARLEDLWSQAEGMARVRYETGDGAQSDLLRAQLERSRLKQRRWALAAEEQRRIAVLNRLRGHTVDEAVATSRSLADLPDPAVPEVAAAWADAETRSPELRRWQLDQERSSRLTDLARKDTWPDLTVSAAVMPRGGDFPPMWQAGLSFPLPAWAGSKQSRAVAEGRLRETASLQGAEATRQLLRQRVAERVALLDALVNTNRLYRSELLIQSEVTVTSTMAQYQVGRIAFASVLEAITGHVADLNAYLESAAAAQRLDIAQAEVSLDADAGLAAAGMSGSPVPGAGAMGAGSSPSAAEGSPAAAGGQGPGSMKRM
ncbi:MAG: TolC family protein [bacterium]|nr:TolC family protein [bacterium]MBK9305413.1 TolC family protein [bacterium]